MRLPHTQLACFGMLLLCTCAPSPASAEDGTPRDVRVTSGPVLSIATGYSVGGLGGGAEYVFDWGHPIVRVGLGAGLGYAPQVDFGEGALGYGGTVFGSVGRGHRLRINLTAATDRRLALGFNDAPMFERRLYRLLCGIGYEVVTTYGFTARTSVAVGVTPRRGTLHERADYFATGINFAAGWKLW